MRRDRRRAAAHRGRRRSGAASSHSRSSTVSRPFSASRSANAGADARQRMRRRAERIDPPAGAARRPSRRSSAFAVGSCLGFGVRDSPRRRYRHLPPNAGSDALPPAPAETARTTASPSRPPPPAGPPSAAPTPTSVSRHAHERLDCGSAFAINPSHAARSAMPKPAIFRTPAKLSSAARLERPPQRLDRPHELGVHTPRS